MSGKYGIRRYQENWKYIKFGKHEIGKYQENWKSGKFC